MLGPGTQGIFLKIRDFSLFSILYKKRQGIVTLPFHPHGG